VVNYSRLATVHTTLITSA